MLSPWMPVDRSSMPAERLKNAATIIEHNIYLGTPTGLVSHQSTQRTLKAPYIRIRVTQWPPKSTNSTPTTLSNVPTASK